MEKDHLETQKPRCLEGFRDMDGEDITTKTGNLSLHHTGSGHFLSLPMNSRFPRVTSTVNIYDLGG